MADTSPETYRAFELEDFKDPGMWAPPVIARGGDVLNPDPDDARFVFWREINDKRLWGMVRGVPETVRKPVELEWRSQNGYTTLEAELPEGQHQVFLSDELVCRVEDSRADEFRYVQTLPEVRNNLLIQLLEEPRTGLHEVYLNSGRPVTLDKAPEILVANPDAVATRGVVHEDDHENMWPARIFPHEVQALTHVMSTFHPEHPTSYAYRRGSITERTREDPDRVLSVFLTIPQIDEIFFVNGKVF